MIEKDSPILVVDDSMTMRQTLKGVLNGAGYTDIHIAVNGKDAFVKIRDALDKNLMYKIIFLTRFSSFRDGKIVGQELANEF